MFHCGGGRDRAGDVAQLVLALAGVQDAAIAEDYELSYERLPARYAAHDKDDQGPSLRAFLAELGSSPVQVIIALLAEIDVTEILLRGGLSDEQLRSVRQRLLSRPLPL